MGSRNRLKSVAAVLLAAAASVDGRMLYETKCAACHGKDGIAKPPGKGSRNFSDPAFQGALTDDAIAAVTLDGRGKMPGYRSKLTGEQVGAITAHIRTLGPAK